MALQPAVARFVAQDGDGKIGERFGIGGQFFPGGGEEVTGNEEEVFAPCRFGGFAPG
jgi:hypothetical protein